MDYSADNADIGMGGIGPDGYTFTVIRTEAGHEAWQKLLKTGWVETIPLEDQPKAVSILARLSKYKRNRPLPALMPSLDERIEIGNLDPKNFYKDYVKPGTETEDQEGTS
jgi:coenzyme F420-reducing hydrogenase beta subunit